MSKKRNRRPKLTIEEVQSYFRRRGYKLIDTTYEGTKAPLVYLCKCGKKRVTCFNAFSRGFRCQYCVMKEKYPNAESNKQIQRDRLVLRETLFTVTDVADFFNVKTSDLYQAIYEQRIPGPTHPIPGKARKYYKREDLKALQKLIMLEREVA